MKQVLRHFRLAAVAAVCVVTAHGCVDREYSLDNFGQDEIYIGDVITTPPVNAHISFEGMMGGMEEIERILEENGFTMDDIGIVEMFIGEQEFSMNVPLEAPIIPEEMMDMLDTGSGTLELLLDVNSTLPMTVEFHLDFVDDSGNVVTEFKDIVIAKAVEGSTVTETQRQDVSELLEQLHRVSGIDITLLRPDLEKVKFLLDNYIEVSLRLEKTGGIKLNGGE